MPKNKEFRLVASARETGNRKGEVTVYSAIYPYKWGEDDPTVTSNDFIQALSELDVDEITVRINSPGGVVTEAIAIRTALMKHKAKKIIDIEGACDSAATLIACLPGAKVRMAKGGEYMIHRCSGGAWGNADKLLSAYNAAIQTDNGMAEIYAERTGKSKEECLEMMTAESWFGAEEAKEAGFVDEILESENAAEEEFQFAACAFSQEEIEVMRESYDHAPEHPVRTAQAVREDTPETAETTLPEGANNPVSNENTAVAAGSSTENNVKGVEHTMELRDATAEQIRQENPTAAQEIANAAIEAERNRTARIDKLTLKGARYAEMAAKAKAEGTSVEDFLAQIVEAQAQEGAEYLEARRAETAPTGNIGGGDAKDHDEPEQTADKLAAEIAELAKGMTANTAEMA
ncbi:MAG: Clp protease ClpP [Clostridia bacterium]|nr:Clp protease ClpP [Clostridia bacterium]